MIEPSSIEELSTALGELHEHHGRLEGFSLARLNTLVAHTPADMTATAAAGMTLGSLQNALRKHGQILPLDPPDGDRLTLREILDHDLSGPRRFGYGTVRDWVIGLKAVLPDGRVFTSGGKVVKNVAGYDLHKLLIGARGELGVIVEVTFKVSPLPECEVFLRTSCRDLEDAAGLTWEVLDSRLRPVAIDLHRNAKGMELFLALSGTNAELDWQLNQVPDRERWKEVPSITIEAGSTLKPRDWLRVSFLPERLASVVSSLPGDEPFICRAGNGVLLRPTVRRPNRSPSPLESRVGALFDPRGVLRHSSTT